MNRTVKTILGVGIAAITLMGIAVATLHSQAPVWVVYRMFIHKALIAAGAIGLVVFAFIVGRYGDDRNNAWFALWINKMW